MPHELPILTTPNDNAHILTGKWWHREGDRIACDLCPRHCVMKEGDRGFCFVRQNLGGEMKLTTYGLSTGFCIDPIEKKPLNHFYPGTSVLSFGTAGCNLGCKFCQNWDISKSREVERLSSRAFPEDIARAAKELGCRSVAFTYNDPVIWAEYAIDTARACRAVGIKSVAVTAGYITTQARAEFYGAMDAANVDLKAFTEDFYFKLTLSHLEPVLDTLQWLKTETDVWFEITNLIIPDANDSPDELKQLCDWVLASVGDEVPVHFTAFHPDFRMTDRGRTPPETLNLAREIAQKVGLKYVYTGNVDDVTRQSTYCPNCGNVVIERNWYQLGQYSLDGSFCRHCGLDIPGRFDSAGPGNWGRKRAPVDMRRFANTSTLPNPPSPRQQRTPPMSTTPETELLAVNDEQQQALLQAAAEHIKAACSRRTANIADPELAGLGSQAVHGIYVSLKRNGHLRGCCGFFGRQALIKDGLHEAAFRTATNDVRFPPVSITELPFLDLEVWLLQGPELMQEQGEDRVGAVLVGRDGLHITMGDKAGLLLPGVPVENGWDAEEFLNRICLKAQLTPTVWKDPSARILKFAGQSFSGRVVEDEDANNYLQFYEMYSPQQIEGYANYAYETLMALFTGATPMFYCPTIPDGNVNAVFMAVKFDGHDRELMASRWSLANCVPLQSTLFGICEELAKNIRLSGNIPAFRVELAIAYDPAMHGTVENSDLQGIVPLHRSVLVLERNKSAWLLDSQADAATLVKTAAEHAQVSEPAAAQIFSFSTQATRSSMQMQSVPRARTGGETRPPAVAGKFYPAEPDKLNAMLDDWLSADVTKKSCTAIMVPHAGWQFSGRIAAEVLNRVEFPNTIIAIGPKHTPNGVDWAIAPHRTWELPGQNVESDIVLARKLSWAIPGLDLDFAAHANEHGIEVELPIIARLAPETKVVGITVGGGNLDRCDQFAEGMAKVITEMEEPPLLLISSDMNHFANDTETRRLDELALSELDRLDEDKLYQTCRANHISMCGMLPAVIVLKTLRKLEKLSKSERASYATTADVTGDVSRVVGYAGMWFE